MKIDKVILLVTYDDYSQEHFTFQNQKNYRTFVSNNTKYFENKNLKKWELYFGYKVAEG